TLATDVLGHGVNLPCETLLFAETTKFDGEERRDLLPWELAQIAGRAGRFGLVERGHVGVLAGLAWARADPDLVESALEPRGRLAAVEKRLAERRRRLSLEDTWKLVNAPVDEDHVELLATLALAIAGDTAQRPLLAFLLDPLRLRDASLEEAEQAGRVASILR